MLFRAQRWVHEQGSGTYLQFFLGMSGFAPSLTMQACITRSCSGGTARPAGAASRRAGWSWFTSYAQQVSRPAKILGYPAVPAHRFCLRCADRSQADAGTWPLSPPVVLAGVGVSVSLVLRCSSRRQSVGELLAGVRAVREVQSTAPFEGGGAQ